MSEERLFDGVCIDSPETRYPEDCFRIERTEDGWLLEVAVPDIPARFSDESMADTIFLENSGVDTAAVKLAVRPEHYAFKPRTERPCIVVKATVSSDGEIAYGGWERATHAGICHTDVDIEKGSAPEKTMGMWREAASMIEAVRNRSAKTSALLTGSQVGIINVIAGCALGSHLQREGKGVFLNQSRIGGSSLSRLGDHETADRSLSIMGLPYAQFTSPLRRYADLHNIRELLGVRHRSTEDVVLVDGMNAIQRMRIAGRKAMERYGRTKDPEAVMGAVSSGMILGKLPEGALESVRTLCRSEGFARRVQSMMGQFGNEFPERADDALQSTLRGVLRNATLERNAEARTAGTSASRH